VYKVALSPQCADVTLTTHAFRVPTGASSSLAGRGTYTADISNKGPDDAMNVVLLAQIFGGPGFQGIDKIISGNGLCTQSTAASVAVVRCTWSKLAKNETDFVDILWLGGSPSAAVDMRGRLEASAFSTVTPDPNINNNFSASRVLSADGKERDVLNSTPNPSGTISIIQRGH
jgi:hypothetical protein